MAGSQRRDGSSRTGGRRLLGSSWQAGSAQAWPASAAGWRADADPWLALTTMPSRFPATGPALSSGSQPAQNQLAER
jgi:hypothetical protein